MIDQIAEALDAVDPAAQRRLVKCLPVLGQAIARWHGTVAPGGLTLACATPRAAVIVSSSGWPDIDPLAAGKIKRGDAALALVRAIESTGASDIIVAATYVLLGERTIAAHAADLDRIVRAGGRALTALLIERRGNDVAMVCTLVEMPPAETVH